MMRSEVARKYSQALFALGKEHNNLLVLRDELNETWQIIKQHDELKKILFHHRVLPEDKKEILKQIFTNQLSGLTFNFLYLLIDKRREYFLEEIIQDFNRLVNREEEIAEVEVISAIKLSQELKENLKSKLGQLLGYKKIMIKESCDPGIIGGLVIKLGDYIIDGSIKKQLESLEERIAAIPVSELGVEIDAN